MSPITWSTLLLQVIFIHFFKNFLYVVVFTQNLCDTERQLHLMMH